MNNNEKMTADSILSENSNLVTKAVAAKGMASTENTLNTMSGDITYEELKSNFSSVFDDYEFIHVETISTICNDYQNNFNLVDTATINDSNEYMIDVFSEFSNLPIEQKKLSNIFYNYIIQILDTRHHNKIKTKEIRQNYIDTLLKNHIQMFKSELMLYGYIDTPKLI